MLNRIKSFFQKLNHFAEKHVVLHKDIGEGKVIFYYRSFWNVILRRKCNQYVVDISDIETFYSILSIYTLLHSIGIDRMLELYQIHLYLLQRVILFLLCYTLVYHLSAMLIFIRKYTSIDKF